MNPRSHSLVRAGALMVALSCVAAWADVDKSGVRPSVLSLPSGPGAIEGLGESFEPQLNSGTASYSVKLKTLPGRAGFAPDMTLVYNAGNGCGTFGLGWKLQAPCLQRQTDKGLPFYTDRPYGDGVDNDRDGTTDEADEFDSIVFSGGEELVYLADETYRCENESEFLRFRRSGSGWLAHRKDGVELRFGTTVESRIEGGTGRIFRWLLESMTDLNGNEVTFTYAPLDAGSQRYLQEVRYNDSAAGGMRIVFNYETRPDVITDYRPGILLKTAYRCQAIAMYAGPDHVRTYRLAYEAVSDTQFVSLLSSVTQVGRDEVRTLPPATFTYVPFTGTGASVASMPDAPGIALNDGNIDITDLNGDALPDILDTTGVPHDYALNLGPDSGGVVRWAAMPPEGLPGAGALHLGAATARLADMNADGRTDLLNLDGASQDVTFFEIEANDGQLAWRQVEVLGSAHFDLQDADTRMLDANNDKRTDVMRTSGADCQVWLNLDDGRWSAPFEPAMPNANLRFSNGAVRLADMNGDRLQDLVWLENGNCAYYPAMGFGQFGPAVPIVNPPAGIVTPEDAFLSDINGDGLADVLYVSGGVARVWLNAGIDPANHARGRFASQSFDVPAPATNSNTAVRQCDINGSGSTDILWCTPDQATVTYDYLDFAPGEQPYQLKTITNGIGRTVTISYRSSVEDMVRDREAGRPWPKGMPIAVPVVARYEVHDGINGYYTEIAYHDAFYDGGEQEFRGFAAADKRELGDASAPDLIMAYSFDTGEQAEVLKGKPLSLEARNDAGEVFYRETYTWHARKLADGVLGDVRKVHFAEQREKLRDVIEKGAGTPVQLKWEYAYDAYGNMTRQAEHGRLDGAWDDERVTVSSFTGGYSWGQSLWVLDRPVERRITDESGELVAHQRAFYDGNTVLGKLSRGNATRTEDWVAGGKYVVSSRSDYDEYGNAIALYDPLYGIEAGHSRELVYDAIYHTFPVEEHIDTGERLLSMYATYDAGWGVMTSSTEFNGFTTAYGYDTFGRITSVTKPPDVGATVAYDYVLAHDLGGGLLINWIETRQRETGAGGTVDSRVYHDGLGRPVMTRSEGEEPGQIVVSDTVQFNARKQPWRKYLPYFETGTLDYSPPPFNGGFTEHHYDATGREIKMIQPDGSFGITVYEPLAKTIHDEEQTRAGSPHEDCGMKYIEDGLLDENGAGRLRRVHEIVRLTDTGEVGPLTQWVTRYRYDLLGNFTGYTDSQNNQKHITYDGLSRKVAMDDPDRGAMLYAYDDAGNLVRTIDAKGQVIDYAYDGVNRLKAEYYGSATPAVEYHYDVPFGPVDRGEFWMNDAVAMADIMLHEDADAVQSGHDLNSDGKLDVADVALAETAAAATPHPVTARNTLGYLAWVRDQSGEEHNSYDERGRVEWTVKRIIDSGPDDLRNFYTGMEFDSMDRVTRLTYPDSTYVDYEFNTRGLLERIPNVIDAYDYNPAGQNAVLALACGVTTTYSYDGRLRLSRIHSLRHADGIALQDLNYAYDDVSNITRITDGRTTAELDAIGVELGIGAAEARKFDATQDFTYDSLYRLTGAENATVYGSIDYRYDRIGNMVYKGADLLEPDPMMDLGEMTYGGEAGAWGRNGGADGAPGPHAVSGTLPDMRDRLPTDHDANGNVTQMSGMRLRWNAKDIPVAISGETMTASYTYDYAGDRASKRTRGSQEGNSYYINGKCELHRDGRLVKFIDVGGRRLANSVSMVGRAGPVRVSSRLLTNHLGTVEVALERNGGSTYVQSAYPFGGIRRERYGEFAGDRLLHRFAGQEDDPESTLLRFPRRSYSAALGRFLSIDKKYADLRVGKTDVRAYLRKPQELNLYSYVANSPVRYVDPLGEDKAEVEEAVGLEAGGKLFGVGASLTVKHKTTKSYEVGSDNKKPEITEAWVAGAHIAVVGVEGEKGKKDGVPYEKWSIQVGPAKYSITKEVGKAPVEKLEFQLLEFKIPLLARFGLSLEGTETERNVVIEGGLGPVATVKYEADATGQTATAAIDYEELPDY